NKSHDHVLVVLNDTSPTEIYTLSLHDALPISLGIDLGVAGITANDPLDIDGGANLQQNFPVLTSSGPIARTERSGSANGLVPERSEEHTSELQSRVDLVCRLLLEKKNSYIVRP